MVEVEVVMIERRYVSIIIFDMKWAFVTTANATVYRKTASGQLKISVSTKTRWEWDTQIMLNRIQSCRGQEPGKWYTERGMCRRSYLLILSSVCGAKGSSDGSHNSWLWWPINLRFISSAAIYYNNCQMCVQSKFWGVSANALLINLQLGQCRWVIDRLVLRDGDGDRGNQ